jgi:hypothetical protein
MRFRIQINELYSSFEINVNRFLLGSDCNITLYCFFVPLILFSSTFFGGFFQFFFRSTFTIKHILTIHLVNHGEGDQKPIFKRLEVRMKQVAYATVTAGMGRLARQCADIGCMVFAVCVSCLTVSGAVSIIG